MPGRNEDDIGVLRAFNRAYTAKLGLLNAHLADSEFTLSEGRILFELAHRREPTAAQIAKALDLDRAQVSRTLKRFAARGLLLTRNDPHHRRHQLLSLTDDGLGAFKNLDEGAQKGAADLLAALPPLRRCRFVRAATTIRDIFQAEDAPSLILRDLRTGDLGHIVHRQAVLYAAEYGYDWRYEALIAHILAEFRQSFDPERDAAWIAELDGEIVGSIFLVQASKTACGKLRLLYVEPDARGHGVGSRLIDNCIDRARAVGYRQLELWTDGQLTAARRLYERAGFVLEETAREQHFGRKIDSETWRLSLE